MESTWICSLRLETSMAYDDGMETLMAVAESETDHIPPETWSSSYSCLFLLFTMHSPHSCELHDVGGCP